jgi:hypothetical protein
MNKRYTANNRQSLLLILMLPDGGQMSIEFKHGYSLHNEAYFMTNDETIQEVLENSPKFNSTYRLSEVNGMDIAEYNSRKDLAENGDLGSLSGGELTPMTFPNGQAAKEWLSKEPYNIAAGQLGSKAKIVEKAKELGFEVTFESDNK